MADFDINELLQNPMFMGGVSGLLAPRDDRAKALLGGIQSAIAQKNATQQQQLNSLKIAQAQKQADFNPQDYMTGSTPGTNTPQALTQQQQMPSMPSALAGPNGGGVPMQLPPQQGDAGQVQAPAPSTMANGGKLDLQGLLGGGLQAGFSPSDVAGMAGFMDPSAAIRAKMLEPVKTGPGDQITIPATGQILASNNNAPPSDPTAVLQRTVAARDQARASGNTAMADQLDALVQKQSGVFEQNQSAERIAELKNQHGIQNDFRQQARDQANQQQEFQQAQKVQGQTNQFSNQIQKIGLPQAQQQLDTIQGIMSKYDGKTLPGFNPVDSLMPTAMLSQEGQQLRQAVSSFANVLLKTRSGAAVTDPEQRRFMEELGNGKFMSSTRLRQGMQQMQGLLDSEKKNAAAGVSQEVLDSYAQAGGDIDFSKFRGTTSAKKAAVSIDHATPDDIAAEMARRGLK